MSTVLAPPEEKLITGEELARMTDIKRSELINGRLIQMTPTGNEHGAIELRIGARLLAHVEEQKLGKVRVGEVGIYIRRNPDTIRAADVLYISSERYAARRSVSYLDVAPELIVEILSPGDSWSEVMQKMRDYFSIGVRVIWIADPAARTVYAYRSTTDVREFGEQAELVDAEVLPGFSVKVAELFEI